MLVDAGDELVCQGCGIVREKMVVETTRGGKATIDVTKQALGSYMGSIEMKGKERRSSGFSKVNTSYRYLKLVSDFAGRDEGGVYDCIRMIERVGGRLVLPTPVIQQAVATARKVLASGPHDRRVTIAAVSAYSLMAACKVDGVASVSVREIVRAHADQGRRVKTSSIIQVSLDSPIKTMARKPEEYIPMVLARLSMERGRSAQGGAEGIWQTSYANALRELARDVLSEVEDGAKAGRRPCALAASAVYAAEAILARRESRRRRITQRDLAECGDTAEYTIREQCSSIFMPVAERLEPQIRTIQTLPIGR